MLKILFTLIFGASQAFTMSSLGTASVAVGAAGAGAAAAPAPAEAPAPPPAPAPAVEQVASPEAVPAAAPAPTTGPESFTDEHGRLWWCGEATALPAGHKQAMPIECPTGTFMGDLYVPSGYVDRGEVAPYDPSVPSAYTDNYGRLVWCGDALEAPEGYMVGMDVECPAGTFQNAHGWK